MTNWEYVKEQILQSVTIQDIIEKYTNNNTIRNRCKCFACNGNQARTMSLNKGYAYCFRCGKSYNQIQAVMEINQCDFKTACNTIIVDFNLCIELDKPLTYAERQQVLKRKLEREKEKIRKTAEEEFRITINNKIVEKMRKCENYIFANGKYNIEYYYTNDKVVQNIMICEKEQKRLDWLYSKINGLPRDEDCEWEYIMPKEDIDVLRQIYMGGIKI